ncbi:FimV/HubP family polar landmark protein [Legionella qingyii]|nr:FimV/HubP family polar landmark protein [Legionella qingyii]
MKVESALDQPFLAEIELLDVQDVSLSGIKVGLAEPQSYRSLGIERSEEVNSLSFDIRKNEKGKFVVEVHSTERMTDPYVQLIVDLIWPKGQIYKVYTVLLDPPGYKLANATAQSGLTYQRKFANHQNVTDSTKKYHKVNHAGQKKIAVYGPTIFNENVWQIAQRYKTSEAILPQIVLAIVGANPEAFVDGNLNGLKTGVRLKIPSDKEFQEVPADLATVEVMAHDKAWNEKASINHVIAPPYITGQASSADSVEYSQIPPVPKFSDVSTLVPNQTFSRFTLPSPIPSLETQKQVSPEQNRTLKAEISITTAAVDSLRESNALLTEQLSLLQTQNKKLQNQLDMRDQELQLIRNQIQTMMKERIAIAGQANSKSNSDQPYESWILFLLLLVAGGASGVVAYYYFKWRDQGKKGSPTEKSNTLHRASTRPIISSDDGLITKDPLQERKSEPQVKSEPEVKSVPEVKFKSELKPEPKLEDAGDLGEHTSAAIEPQLLITDEGQLLEIIPTEEKIESSKQTDESKKDKHQEDNLLEFESGLHHKLTTKPTLDEDNSQELVEDDNGLDFTPSSSVEVIQTQKEEESRGLSQLKNKKALDTLLALARTYIGMEDIESALHSLNEVMEHGTKSQKEEAQRLIDEIQGKS